MKHYSIVLQSSLDLRCFNVSTKRETRFDKQYWTALCVCGRRGRCCNECFSLIKRNAEKKKTIIAIAMSMSMVLAMVLAMAMALIVRVMLCDSVKH